MSVNIKGQHFEEEYIAIRLDKLSSPILSTTYQLQHTEIDFKGTYLIPMQFSETKGSILPGEPVSSYVPFSTRS